MKNIMSLLFLISCTHLQLNADLRISRIQHFYEAREYEQVINENNQLKKLNHFSPELSILAAKSFSKLDQLEKAAEELNFYRQKNPLSAPVNLALAETYTAQKKYDEARKILFEIIQNKSADQKLAWTQVARTYFEQSNWDLLVKLDRLTVENTDEINFLVGQAFYKKKIYSAAVAKFQATYNSPYEKEKSAEYLTYLYHALGNVEAAKKSLATLLEINKNNTVAEKMFYRLVLKENNFDKLSVLYLYERTYSDDWAKNEIVATLNERGQDKKAIEFIADQKQKEKSNKWIDQAYSQALNPKSVAAERSPASKFHIVQKGETLRLISLNLYGTKHRWDDIYSLNKDEIKDSNVLASGTKLKLPE